MNNIAYDLQFVKQVKESLHSGMTIAEAKVKYEVIEATLRYWKKQHQFAIKENEKMWKLHNENFNRLREIVKERKRTI